MIDTKKYFQYANAIRSLTIDSIEKAQSGHPGMPLGMADVATVLFKDFLKFNPKDPTWFNRDRFVLSAGHGSMLLYSALYLLGYDKVTIDSLKKFRQLHCVAAGHPEYDLAAGIETTTGPLGQGLANAVGMALAESITSAKHGSDLVNHYTYTIVGDGCLMEGISYEVIALAGHHQLNKLIVLFDDNNITIDGETNISTSEDVSQRFKANKWNVLKTDGHNYQQIHDAISQAQQSTKPTLICCKTVIGFGSPNKSGKSSAHSDPFGLKEANLTKEQLGCSVEPFQIESAILTQWRSFANRTENEYNKWQQLCSKANNNFHQAIKRELPIEISVILQQLKNDFEQNQLQEPTRIVSEKILNTITPMLPNLIGGSADLGGANGVITQNTKEINITTRNGNYIHYGVREHAMAAISNGMFLHGGILPYCATFLSFADYCRPAIRLSALMQLPIIYIMTHDSIGLGEDGPTHQPIEHLCSFRAMPNILVLRPANASEVVECWTHALLNAKHMPSMLVLSRQTINHARSINLCNSTEENLCSKGGYIISDKLDNQPIDGCIIATGSEVEIAIDVQKELKNLGKNIRVISMPCMELFDQQSKNYKDAILPKDTETFVIEAASTYGWEKYATRTNNIFGIKTFGASAPYEKLYEYFELTSDKISKKIIKILSS